MGDQADAFVSVEKQPGSAPDYFSDTKFVRGLIFNPRA
jgi:hypothetical protein